MTPSRKLTPQICAMYLGAECQHNSGTILAISLTISGIQKMFGEYHVIGETGKRNRSGAGFPISEIKLILRPLSSMTEEEGSECFGDWEDFIKPTVTEEGWESIRFAPEHFEYLLSKSFDLFSLLPDGLALELDKAKQI